MNNDPTEDIYLYDFVAGQSNGRQIEGQVVSTPTGDGDIYLVQIYDERGPTAYVAQAARNDIYPHPTTRMDVVEHTSQYKENVR